MNIKRSITLLIIAVSFSVLYAQKTMEKHSVSVGWGVVLPTGSSTFTNKPTWVTPHVGYEYRVFPQLSAGFSLGYRYSNEKGDTKDRYNSDLVSGQSHRTLTAIPMQIELLYFPLGACLQKFQPFLGIGGGLNYAKYYITGDALHSEETANWARVVTPQVGFRMMPFLTKKLSIDARVYWQNAANNWKLLHTSSQQGVGFEFRIASLLF